MKRICLLSLIACLLSLDAYSQSELKQNLLGNWKLEKNEMATILLDAMQGSPKGNDLAQRALAEDRLNFYSGDSLSTTIIDGFEILQDSSIWTLNQRDSVIWWTNRFTPKGQRMKVLELDSENLVLQYLSSNPNAGPWKLFYSKLEDE